VSNHSILEFESIWRQRAVEKSCRIEVIANDIGEITMTSKQCSSSRGVDPVRFNIEAGRVDRKTLREFARSILLLTGANDE
jgi:hypothetical protein